MEEESLEHLSSEQVNEILKGWVKVAADTAHATQGERSEYEQGFQEAVKRMQWLYLAEPWLVTAKIFDAMKLSGWTPPEGAMLVTYKDAK